MSKIKKGISVIAACAMMFSMALTAYATHGNPKGGLCNNTYFNQNHTQEMGTSAIDNHPNYNGSICYRSRTTYTHVRNCTSCGAQVGSFVSACKTTHSSCGEGPTYSCIS